MITKIYIEIISEDYVDLELLFFSFILIPILIILDIVTILIQPIYYIAYKKYKRGDSDE